MRDKYGRKYLKITDAKEDQTVILDDGFTCHQAGKVTLRADGDRLWFACNDGRHYIDGQADDDIHCIGVYPCL